MSLLASRASTGPGMGPREATFGAGEKVGALCFKWTSTKNK